MTHLTKTPADASQDDAPTGRILRRRFFLQPHSTMLSQARMQAATNNRVLDSQGWTGRRVMGYKLPEWQRPKVWTDEQCLAFIESIWVGVGLGTYMVNMTERDTACDLVLLDGQQRMLAIERYLASELAMTGEDGNGYYWDELTEREQAHFLRIPFPWNCTEYRTDAELREAYNRHNFGGTAHTYDQRA